MALDEAEHLAHQTGAGAIYTAGLPGLAQVLAWKPGGDERRSGGQRRQRAYVRVQRNIGEAPAQHFHRRWGVLAQDQRLVPGMTEPPFEATDAGKQARNPVHSPTFRYCLSSS